MKLVKGKYNSAKVFADIVDETTLSQIQTFVNAEVSEGSDIAIMPDCHAGAGCVIGLTMTLGNWIVPNLVGVDIGCGVLAVKLDTPIDFATLDEVIRTHIPYGFRVRQERFPTLFWEADLSYKNIWEISNKIESNPNRNCLAIGSLGGGNHFIEVDVDEEGNQWLVVHTGSRKFGYDIARYYQTIAKESYGKAGGLEGLSTDSEAAQNYLTCAKLAQEFADVNRWAIVSQIIEQLDNTCLEVVHSVHNYIDFSSNPSILRKGAISTKKDEELIIPLNMKDGCIIGVGKGLETWNYSAPHGAGRVMGRREAKRKLNVNDYKATMKGIWSTCISEKTLDEAPMAYKPASSIVSEIEKCVRVTHRLKPVYVFKAD